MRVPLLLLACVLCAYGVEINCPIDCAITPNVSGVVDDCVALATLCNPIDEAIARDDWLSILGVTNASAVTPSTPTTFVYQPTMELVDRISCSGVVVNDTIGNGTIVYICIQRFFCYVDPDTTVFAFLTGVCAASTFNFPAVLHLYYIGPATIVGGGFFVDPDHPTSVTFDTLTFNGGGTTASFFDGCMENSNFTWINAVFYGWQGDYVLKAESCTYATRWELYNVFMIDIPGTAIYVEALNHLIIQDFVCERCAKRVNSGCVYTKMSWIADSEYRVVNVSCWRVQNLLPPRCRYCITGNDGFCGSRCNEGEVQVYDRIATAAFANCPIISTMVRDYFTNMLVPIEEFDPICRVYSTPQCNFLTVAPSINLTQHASFYGGDIIWDIDAPLICVAGGTVNPLAPPFYILVFQNAFGDAIVPTPVPPLPASPGFVDGSFEDYGWEWVPTVNTIVIPITVGVVIPPRTGDWAFFGSTHLDNSASQSFDTALSDVNTSQYFQVWCTTFGSPPPIRYLNRWISVHIDGVEVGRFQGAALQTACGVGGVYKQLTFPAWVVPLVGMHVVTLRAFFIQDSVGPGGSGTLMVLLDDASWSTNSSLNGSPNDLLDKSFEPHSLTWEDTPFGEAINRGVGNCNPRTGDYDFSLKEGDNYAIQQEVTFPDNGVYAISGWMERRNPSANYAGASVAVTVDGAPIGTTPIVDALLPVADTYTHVAFSGLIYIYAAPETHDIGLSVDFSALGSNAKLCIDDLVLSTVGIIGGLPPSTEGFSAQVISSAPYIVNQTCSCSAYILPPRNATLLPCLYTLNPTTVCDEELPSCCAAEYENQNPLVDVVLWNVCDDLSDPACVFLVDCQFFPGGQILNCTEFACPNVTPPHPLGSPGDVAYLFDNCTAYHPTVVGGVVVGSITPYVMASGDDIEYTNTPVGEVELVDAIPLAFWVNCSLTSIEACVIYRNCAAVTYDPGTGAYALSSCERVNCTLPPYDIMTLEAEINACVIINATLPDVTVVDGGWVARADGSAPMFTADQWAFWLLKHEYHGEVLIDPIWEDAALAPYVPGCTPHTFFRVCPCYANGTYTVPAGGDYLTPNPPSPDTFYVCANNVASCRCTNAALALDGPAPNGTYGIWIANVPDSVERFLVVDNRAQQYQYGVVIEQVSRELVASNSIVIPQRDDEKGICRTVMQNDNEFVTADVSECLQGNPGGPYTTECWIYAPGVTDSICPLPIYLVAEDQSDCFVDDRATSDIPGFGVTIFNTIQSAVDENSCDFIYVRFSTKSSYFEEDLEFDSGNKDLVLWSLEGAIIVGNHVIKTNTNNITFIGLRFIHPADNRQPLFAVDRANDVSNVDYVTFLNCDIDGAGCRKCGIFQTKRLNRITLNYTAINDFEFFALKLDDAVSVTIAHCSISDTVGRAFLLKISHSLVADSNALVDTRGGADLKGAAIFSVTFTDPSACNGNDPSRRCLFRNNVQVVNTSDTVERFQDVCFYFARGSMRPTDIYDNVCRLAQTGMVFLKTEVISSANLVYLMQANPLMRPSLFWITDPTQPGYRARLIGFDYEMRTTTTFLTPDGKESFLFSNSVETNYDTSPFVIPISPIRCEYNRNWDSRFGFGQGVTIPRMGVEHFNNATIGWEFCQDRRYAEPIIGGGPATPAFILYARSFNGSRFSPENITMARDGWIIGDDTAACCRSPTHRPGVVGTCHRILTRRVNVTMLVSALPKNPQQCNMWSSGPLESSVEVVASTKENNVPLPAEILFDMVQWDGRYILPGGELFVMDLLVGTLLPKNTKSGKLQNAPIFGIPVQPRPGTNAIPPYTEQMVSFTDCEILRFPAINSETSPNGANYVNDLGQYPFMDGIRVRFVNRVNATNRVTVDRCLFADLDKSGLLTYFPTNLIIRDTRFRNCSTRAQGNTACALMVGNDVSQLIPQSRNVNVSAIFANTPSLIWIVNTTLENTRPILYQYDDRKGHPGLVSGFWILGYPNTTDYCVINSSATGVPLAFRQAETLNETIIQCSLYTTPTTVVGPDRARYLRAQCQAGNLQGMQGTTHDMGFGEPETDLTYETIWCDSVLPASACCALVQPAQCWVVQTPSLLVPTNPWLNIYIFGDINLAIENCSASQRIISVVGSNDPFGTGDTAPKTYTQQFSTTVPIVSVNGVSGAMLIRSGSGVTWLSSNNKLNTQCVPVTIYGFKFVHDNAVAVAAWDQQMGTGTDACNLRFDVCEWHLPTEEMAMRVVVGDNFTVINSLVRGDPAFGSRRGISLRGNGSCTEHPVVLKRNRFDDLRGYAFDVRNVARYVIENNVGDNVGGQDFIGRDPYSTYADVCPTPHFPFPEPVVRFVSNRMVTTQTATALVGMMATCWFGRVPIFDKTIVIADNKCVGLEFGMRFEFLPDNSPSGDPKQQLRIYAVNERNIGSKGYRVPPLNIRFDLVKGEPVDDASLVSQPFDPANRGRWCTRGCPRALFGVIWAILALLAACLVFWIVCLLCTGCLTPYQYRDPLISFTDSSNLTPTLNPMEFGNGIINTPIPPQAAIRAEISTALGKLRKRWRL